MKVWVLWDGNTEKVLSVHANEESVLTKIGELYKEDIYSTEADEFEVEE